LSGRFIIYSANPLDIITDDRYSFDYEPEVNATNMYDVWRPQHNRLLMYDFQTNQTGWLGTALGTLTNTGHELAPHLSWDGNYVAFISNSNNLVPETLNKTDKSYEVYHLNRQTGVIKRAVPPRCFYPTPEECYKGKFISPHQQIAV